MIGVLALQGAYQKHMDCLKLLGQPCRLVRHIHELHECHALILPGGETTTHFHLLSNDFHKALQKFGEQKPMFGTCCGLILLSSEIVGESRDPLGLMDLSVKRNAYGSQKESFVTEIDFQDKKVDCFFIRAPQIVRVSSEVKVLATHQDLPVAVQYRQHLALTCHPELADDVTFHRFFIEHCSLPV